MQQIDYSMREVDAQAFAGQSRGTTQRESRAMDWPPVTRKIVLSWVPAFQETIKGQNLPRNMPDVNLMPGRSPGTILYKMGRWVQFTTAVSPEGGFGAPALIVPAP